MNARVDKFGRIVIPKQIREHLGIVPGSRIQIVEQADHVILILRADQTTRDRAHTAAKRFAQDGVPVLGTILNGWKPDRSEHYSYYQTYSEDAESSAG